MVEWCNLSYLKIKSDTEPCIGIRTILSTDTIYEKEDKAKMPFINKHRILWNIEYGDEQYCFVIPKGFCYDGATIPRLFWRVIGSKESNSFLIGSCVHDYMCLHHEVVGNNRELSSLIFRELLKACGVGNLKAQTMYFAVNSFQRLWFNGWK